MATSYRTFLVAPKRSDSRIVDEQEMQELCKTNPLTFVQGYFCLDLFCSPHLHRSSFVSCTYVGLPDAASIEASKMVDADNDRTVLIDASTAFRVNDEWTYGFPGKYYL